MKPIFKTDLRRRYGAKTPKAMTQAILEFCKTINDCEPVWIDVHPAEHADIRMCYENCKEEVERNGGAVVYGWLIWEELGLFLVADFHAVVKRDGILHDITPMENGDERILFLPSDEVWEGDFVDSKFYLLSDRPVAWRLVRLRKEAYDLQQEARRKGISQDLVRRFLRVNSEAWELAYGYVTMLQRQSRSRLAARRAASLN